MKYTGFPLAMWAVFRKSFEQNLVVFGIDKSVGQTVMKKAKGEYKSIIGKIPEFEKGDRFKTNLVNASILAAVLLSLPERPDVKSVEVYYRKSIMTPLVKKMCLSSGKRKFTPKDIEGMKKTAAFRAADRNPYSWNMEYIPYDDGSGYEARFTKCGICTLMKELGLYDLVPAMCALDYTMSEAGGRTDFVREYTLASGGEYCDCGYKKKL